MLNYLYRASFPESLFPVRENDYSVRKYNKEVEIGQEIAQNFSLQIIGLAYNCDKVIETNIKRCQYLGQFFKDYKITILENGSTDYTSDRIKRSTSYKEIELISESVSKPEFSPLDKNRFSYLANLRNKLLSTIFDRKQDYLMVYDFDILGGFSYHGIFHSIFTQKNCVSNGILYKDNERRFYDTIAYRENDPIKPKENIGKLRFDRGLPLRKVNSAFGGLGLYKWNDVKDKRYSGEYGCEHISFHQGLDLYLNPNQIVLYNETDYAKN